MVCAIDEILRGTNTKERIAASAAILRYLEERNCLVLVASHDMELVDLLDGSMSIIISASRGGGRHCI